MGCFAPSASPQVCQHSSRSHSYDAYSELEKFPSPTRPAFRKSQCARLPALRLDPTSTTLGPRGMVEPTSSTTLPRPPTPLWLGLIAPHGPVPNLANADASRRR